MAKNNANMHKAKSTKNDEFYTRLEDIKAECNNYKAQFKDKIIYCNCDDPVRSNFFQYFAVNFKVLGLKKLICTCYDKNAIDDCDSLDAIIGKTELDVNLNKLTQMLPKAYKIVIPDVVDINGDDVITYEDVYLMIKNDIESGEFKYVSHLEGNGDFRSEECVELLKQSDVIVTNPPFSLFREFISLLEEYNKKYLVIGNNNAITYKEIFPLIKENKLWLGYSVNKNMAFKVPDTYEYDEKTTQKINDGYHYGVVPAITWFTNLDTRKRHEELYLYKKYTPEQYPKYDNYDAINVDAVEDIPCDYMGVMGVPITFLDKYNPDQFDIVSFRKGEDGKDLVFTAERERENSTLLSYPCTTSIQGMIKNAEGKINGTPTYARITIRRK